MKLATFSVILLLLSQYANGQASRLHDYDSAVYYRDKRMFNEAENSFLKAKNHFPKDSFYTSNYAKCHKGLMALYVLMNRNNDAKPLAFELKNIIEKNQGKENADYAGVLDTLGRVHMNTDPRTAEKYFKDALLLKQKIFSDTSIQYSVTCNFLGGLYTTIGEYEKGVEFQTKAKKIRAQLLGSNDPAYAQSCNNLAAVYRAIGEYELAEPLALEALRIREKIKPEKKSAVYAITCTNLGNIYTDLGQYSKAEAFYTQAREIRAELPPVNESADYASSCNVLANLYTYMRDYAKAETLYEEARMINKKYEDQRAYGESCSNLAAVYIEKQDYLKAEALMVEAQAAWKDVLTPGDPNIAIGLNTLGDIYFSMNEFEKANKFYSDASSLWQKELGREHPYYSIGLTNIARTKWNRNETASGLDLYYETFSLRANQIDKVFRFTSEKEKQEYMEKIAGNTDEFYSLFSRQQQISKAGNAFDVSISNRNLILSSAEQMKQAVNNSGDQNLADRYDEWIGLKQQLAKMYSKDVLASSIQIKPLEEKANELEKELMKSSSVARLIQKQNTQWQKIKESLKTGEAAIEFIHFRFFNGTRWTDSSYYAAFVLKNDSKEPDWILLTESKRIDSLIRRLGNKAVTIDPFYNNTALYNLVWKPIEKSLTGINTIYFSPAGVLHRISLAAIKMNQKDIISDKYKMVQLFNTASVIQENKVQIKPTDKIVLYGGINYNADSTALRQAALIYKSNYYVSRSLPAGLNDDEQPKPWEPLPATELEVESIAERASSLKIQTRVFKTTDANEESFKSFTGKNSPEFFHLATHGYFFPDPKKDSRKVYAFGGEPFQKSKNPLFRGGLILAGAENAWLGKPVADIEDGILTGYEISNMYLPNTKLVVLSACQTALGDIEGSEGVYGLQRAFKIAGAKNLIMSLWDVDDKTGSEFMDSFYKNMFEGKSIEDAFYSTQQTMKDKYRERPYNWAGWLLIK